MDVLWFIALLCLYLFPAIVADLRGQPNSFAIGMLNLLLGWTLIGWVVALVWACTEPQKRVA